MRNIELKLLVAEDDLDKAFSVLISLVELHPKLFNQVIIHHGRYKDTRRYLSLNTAQKDDIDLELNKIRSSLLELIDQLPPEILSLHEKRIIKDNMEDPTIVDNIKGQEITAEKFFYTLDDNTENSFPEIIKGATRLMILARTGVNLLSQYFRHFEEIGKKNCDIRMLMIGLDSDATKYVYGDSPDVFYTNAERTDYFIRKIQNTIGANFQVKTIKHAPTMSLMIVEKELPKDGFIIVQLYFLHSLIGRDRPLFRIKQSDKWYKPFYNEFNELWKNGDIWDIKKMEKK